MNIEEVRNGRQVLLHKDLGTGEKAAVLAQRSSGLGGGTSILVLVGNNGRASRRYTIQDVLPSPISVFANMLIVNRIASSVPGRSEMRLWAVNLSTGEMQRFNSDLTPMLLSATTNRFAIAGRAPTGDIVLEVFDKNLVLLGTLDLPLKSTVDVLRSFLSFSAPHRLLLVNAVDASYIAITHGRTIHAGQRVSLRGTEVTASREWPGKSTRLTERIILAHTVSKAGRDLFFCGPYSKREGYRLVEFSEDGEQLNTFRLEISERYRSGNVSFSNGSLITSENMLSVMSIDGVERVYGRP